MWDMRSRDIIIYSQNNFSCLDVEKNQEKTDFPELPILNIQCVI